VAAVLDGSLLVAGWVGDSRAYWLPDEGPAGALTVDDSFAAEQVAHGVPRHEAENGPHAHAITRWLGLDAPDHTPRTVSRELDTPGWVLVCSDGLWNYCSEADDLATLVRQTAHGSGAQPTALAEALVDWANAQGGRDNITVALARFDPA
jgi:serine/threonine protein phosphatase PrpC